MSTKNEQNINSEPVGSLEEVVVMFIDLTGYTALSEDLNGGNIGNRLVPALNAYLEVAAEHIVKNGGIVDKYIGDAVMALFYTSGISTGGGDKQLAVHAYAAIRTALATLQEFHELEADKKHIANMLTIVNDNRKKSGRKQLEVSDFGFSIGINCGTALVGHITPERPITKERPNGGRDFTAVGDTINTAARLQDKAELNQILVSDRIIKWLNNCEQYKNCVQPHGFNVQLKNKSDMEVHEVKGFCPEWLLLSKHHIDWLKDQIGSNLPAEGFMKILKAILATNDLPKDILIGPDLTK